MLLEKEIRVHPDKINDPDHIKKLLAKQCNLDVEEISSFQILRKSIDARKNKVVFQLRIKVFIDEEKLQDIELPQYKSSIGAKEVIIIGAGPAGYFCALQCLEQGLRPIIVERGKDVRTRRRDLKAIQQHGKVNPNSNYCFGEGGAGTYSDGKLYTRSHKRGKIESVLQILVQHGANPNILIDAHPHIGSNKLPGIIANIRSTIESYGGVVHFDTEIKDIVVSEGKVEELVCSEGKSYTADQYVLATGHSARDIFRLFYDKKLQIEMKPFALGVRVEHPQEMIDEIQYSQSPRHPNLPAASYRLVTQVDGNGVFSFCMCPGGLIVPAATNPGEIVINGMSLSKRNSAFANSGVVTEISTKELELHGFGGVMGGLEFQLSVEQRMFNAGNGSQQAPAQKLPDFVNGKLSDQLNKTSYIPGLYSAPLHELLPSFVANRIRKGLKAFDQKLKGYYTDEAQIVAVESRTSSPIRIPRHPETLVHPQVSNMYPCGEGAGYAGGILSAALDGRNVARALGKRLNN